MDITGLGAATTAVRDIIGMFFPDKTEEEKRKLEAALVLVQGQLEANKVEAASPNLFTSGWRPSVGWTCSAAFAVQYVIGPMVAWGSVLLGHPVELPKLDLSEMMPILIGMLGLGYYRSKEKMAGVS